MHSRCLSVPSAPRLQPGDRWVSPPQTFPVSSSPCSPAEFGSTGSPSPGVASLSSWRALVTETRLQAISLRGAGPGERGLARIRPRTAEFMSGPSRDHVHGQEACDG